MDRAFLYTHDGQQFGPVSGAVLKKLAQTGQLQATDRISQDGMDNWVRAATVKWLPLGPTSESAGTAGASVDARPILRCVDSGVFLRAETEAQCHL